MDQLGVVVDPLTTHSTHMVPFTFNPHSTSRVKDDDTQMMSLEGVGLESFTKESVTPQKYPGIL